MNATTGTPLAVWPSQTRAGTVAPSCSSSTILVVVCRVTSIGVAPGGRGWGVAAGSSHPHRAALTGRSSQGQAPGSLGVGGDGRRGSRVATALSVPSRSLVGLLDKTRAEPAKLRKCSLAAEREHPPTEHLTF